MVAFVAEVGDCGFEGLGGVVGEQEVAARGEAAGAGLAHAAATNYY